jgi:hypothetical protein
VLQFGGRQITVPDWPLARQVDEHRQQELVGSGDALVIEPRQNSLPIQVGAILVTCLASAALPALIINLLEIPVWIALAVTGVALVPLAMLVRSTLAQLRWITFDRQTQRLIIERRLGFRNRRRLEREYPLDSIKAVQLLHSGLHSVTEPQCAGEQQTISHREFRGYELNLVVDDSDSARLNLASLSDWQWIRDSGNRIAEFLEVPVVDKLYHGP